MCVDGNRGEAGNGGDVAQMASKGFLIDREIVMERQQNGRDDPFGNELCEAWHGSDLLTRTPPS
jgi:hypothetical protein